MNPITSDMLSTAQGADAFVNELSAEAKRCVISSLLRDRIRNLGSEESLLHLTPEKIYEIRIAMNTPDDCFDPLDRIEELTR